MFSNTPEMSTSTSDLSSSSLNSMSGGSTDKSSRSTLDSYRETLSENSSTRCHTSSKKPSSCKSDTSRPSHIKGNNHESKDDSSKRDRHHRAQLRLLLNTQRHEMQRGQKFNSSRPTQQQHSKQVIDNIKLEQIKNKDKNEHSANASQEVKDHLAGFILSKRQMQPRDPNMQHNKNTNSSPYRIAYQSSNCSDEVVANCFGPEMPLKHPRFDDYPLRKTASEPSLPCKAQSSLKRKQIERRSTVSPLLRRKAPGGGGPSSSSSRSRRSHLTQHSLSMDCATILVSVAPSNNNGNNRFGPLAGVSSQNKSSQTNKDTVVPMDQGPVSYSNSQSPISFKTTHTHPFLSRNQRIFTQTTMQTGALGSGNLLSMESDRTSSFDHTNNNFQQSSRDLQNQASLFEQQSFVGGNKINKSILSYLSDRPLSRTQSNPHLRNSQMYPYLNNTQLGHTSSILAHQTSAPMATSLDTNDLLSQTSLSALNVEMTPSSAVRDLRLGIGTQSGADSSRSGMLFGIEMARRFGDVQKMSLNRTDLTPAKLLELQHHQQVKEQVRQAVLQRSSSRSRVLAGIGVLGGSLDREVTMANEIKSPQDLRQFSLDSGSLNFKNQTSDQGPVSVGNLNNQSLRGDTKTLRNPLGMQSSSLQFNSIRHNAVNTFAANSPIPQGNMTAPHSGHATFAGSMNPTTGFIHQRFPLSLLHFNQHSSSSSSASSLISQHDSLDDNSQVIDLTLNSDSRKAAKQQKENPFSEWNSRPDAATSTVKSALISPNEPTLDLAALSVQEAFRHLQLRQIQNPMIFNQNQQQQQLRAMNLQSTTPFGRMASDNLNDAKFGATNTAESASIASVTTTTSSTATPSMSDSDRNPTINQESLSSYMFPLHEAALVNRLRQSQVDKLPEQTGVNAETSPTANMSQLLISQQAKNIMNDNSKILTRLSTNCNIINQYISMSSIANTQNTTVHSMEPLMSSTTVPSTGHKLQDSTTATHLVGLDDEPSTNVLRNSLQRTLSTPLFGGVNSYNGQTNNDNSVLSLASQINIESDSNGHSHQNDDDDIQLSGLGTFRLDDERLGFDQNSSTGLVYDFAMCKHQCLCGNNAHHPENGHRLLSILARFYATGLTGRCSKIKSRRATLDELQLCHGQIYSYYFGMRPINRYKLRGINLADLPIEGLTLLPCGGIGVDVDTPWNEHFTPAAARMAAGCVIEAAISVAKRNHQNAFCLVRPPGHHAEYQQAMGFCFFNSVAIAARILNSKLNVKKILILDWDVHHGNGIQKMFYGNPDVLYMSLHRHDDGNFFPGSGDISELGEGRAVGKTINIAWSCDLNQTVIGDAEYLAAFRAIVMPIAVEFEPEIVLVACGFDGAEGHPPNLGGYKISPACFAHMTKRLMSLADGKIVLALEGGYEIKSICDSATACLSTLLGDQIQPISEQEWRRQPCLPAKEILHRVASITSDYWSSVAHHQQKIECSAFEAEQTIGSGRI
ncbi:Histone deacetylase 5, partial [Fragariocoptes setiger]